VTLEEIILPPSMPEDRLAETEPTVELESVIPSALTDMSIETEPVFIEFILRMF
jgi:hypothetical protein